MASIQKRPNGKWRARYRDPAGHEHARHFERKTDAQRWLDEVTADMLTGNYVDPRAASVTFREYAERWRQAQVHRRSSAAKVESVLRLHAYPSFGSRPLRSVRPSEIQAWVKSLSEKLAPSTVGVAHGIVAAVFKAAVADRLLVASPCDATKLPADHRPDVVPLETEQVLALQGAVPERFRALVTLGAATGVRISEALGLTVDRTGLRPPSARPVVTVDRQLVALPREELYLGPPKRRASLREVPLPRVGVEALAEHLAAFPPTSRTMAVHDLAGRGTNETIELVFTTEDGEPLRRSHVSRFWVPAAVAAGLPEGTTFRDLRHYYASLLIRHGESVKVVQARLGHATAAETLDTYSHLWPDSEDRTRAAVDNVLGAPADSVRTGEAL